MRLKHKKGKKMKLTDFQAKHVPGLYAFNHFEADNGAFIQVTLDGRRWVYCDENGKFSDHCSLESLKKAVEG